MRDMHILACPALARSIDLVDGGEIAETASEIACDDNGVGIDDAARRLRSLLLYLTASGLNLVTPQPLVAEGSNAASRRVHLATYNAGEAYRPLPYDGKVVFMQAEVIHNLEPRAPRRVWGQFLSDLSIRRVPGSHLGMLDEGAAAAAAEISRCLAEVQGW